MRQERMKYIIDNGTYVGTLVNYPVTIAQADTLPELEMLLKEQLKDWIETSIKFSNNSFEAQEVTAEEWLTNHKREVEKWKSISKELYDELESYMEAIDPEESTHEAIKRFNDNW